MARTAPAQLAFVCGQACSARWTSIESRYSSVHRCPFPRPRASGRLRGKLAGPSRQRAYWEDLVGPDLKLPVEARSFWAPRGQQPPLIQDPWAPGKPCLRRASLRRSVRTRGGLDWAVHVSSRRRGGPHWDIAGRIPDAQCEWWQAAWILAGIAGYHAGHPSRELVGLFGARAAPTH